MRSADLTDDIGRTTRIPPNVWDYLFAVRNDMNLLYLKPQINANKWERSYRDTTGIVPAKDVIENRAQQAIDAVMTLPDSSARVELVKRLQQYKDSIPSYF
jgi:hypothetical protein